MKAEFTQLALATEIRKAEVVAVVEAEIRRMAETKRVVGAVTEIKRESLAEASVAEKVMLCTK